MTQIDHRLEANTPAAAASFILLETHGNLLTLEAGQSGARWRVMGGIDESPKTVSEIARSLHLSRQGIQRTADTLTKEGHTKLIPNPNDRRAALLALTEKGRKCLSVIQENQRAWANEIGSRITLRNMTKIERALEMLIESLRQWTESPFERPFERRKRERLPFEQVSTFTCK